MPAGTPSPSNRENGCLLEVREVFKHFPVTRGLLFDRQIGAIKAVDGVSFAIKEGETFGLVGESGCGKSTLGRCILMLESLTAGQVILNGVDLTRLEGEALRRTRPQMQLVFQDAYASLNPRMRIADIVSEPLVVHGRARGSEFREMAAELLGMVGLHRLLGHSYPHMLSGGQRQRVAVARAIALRPRFILCDEPVSALDVSIQSQVLNLLIDLREKLGLTYLFIAHDMSVVRYISDRIAVMYLGRIVEVVRKADLADHALHPYTRALLSAVPVPDPAIDRRRERIILRGEPPSPRHPPSGCRFHPRCWQASARCGEDVPALKDVGGHLVACHRA